VIEGATDSRAAWGLSVPSGTPPWMASIWIEIEGALSVENGDLCIGTRVTESGTVYQRSYSNAAARAGGDPCVPALPLAYFSSSPAQPWYQTTAGATVTIPLTGWSTAPTTDWVVTSRVEGRSDTTLAFTSQITSPVTATIAGRTRNMLTNGRTAMLRVTVPAGAPSGTWASILINNFHLDASGKAPPGEDYSHQSVVGVYIP
jgi:hypothetical protein